MQSALYQSLPWIESSESVNQSGWGLFGLTYPRIRSEELWRTHSLFGGSVYHNIFVTLSRSDEMTNIIGGTQVHKHVAISQPAAEATTSHAGNSAVLGSLDAWRGWIELGYSWKEFKSLFQRPFFAEHPMDGWRGGKYASGMSRPPPPPLQLKFSFFTRSTSAINSDERQQRNRRVRNV